MIFFLKFLMILLIELLVINGVLLFARWYERREQREWDLLIDELHARRTKEIDDMEIRS